MKPAVIVVSGPSGVGKTTVVDRLLERTGGIVRSVSYTTREIRGRERDGVEYHFRKKEDLLEWLEEGRFLEHALVHGNLYGTDARFVRENLDRGLSVLLEIDVEGARQVREKRPGALLIFIMPPSMEELERRLRGRMTDSEEVIEKRLANAKAEIEASGFYDHHVVNDDLGRCVDEVRDIILERGAATG